MCLRRAAHNDFDAEDDRLRLGARQRARATGAVRIPSPSSDGHGDALDPGAERRLPHARSHDYARAARLRVHRCQDVQVTTSGAEADQWTTGARQRTRARPRRRASPSPRPSPR